MVECSVAASGDECDCWSTDDGACGRRCGGEHSVGKAGKSMAMAHVRHTVDTR